jgi:hypothetical protein
LSIPSIRTEKLQSANICSVPSKGSQHAEFQRAVQPGNLLLAVTAARDLGQLTLSDSLALLLLFADKDPGRFERAASRWHARFVLEAGGLTIGEAFAALAAVTLLTGPGRRKALELLDDLGRRHGTRLDVRHHLSPD